MNIIVVGGGMVGAAAALALVKQKHTVTVIEAAPEVSSEGDWDLRISSVHLRNVQWLKQLGVWQGIRNERVFDYTDLAVQSSDGQRVNFSAAEINEQSLGAMIENNALQQALWQQLRAHNVTILCETKVEQFNLPAQTVSLSNGEDLSYDLLIGADGANSQVAQAAGIGFRGWDYDMRCLLAIAEVENELPTATWEVFRDKGPYALLPLSRHEACLIDYRSEQEWQQLSAQPAQVHHELNATFTPHIGPFKVQRFASFPLRRQRALTYQAYNSVVLVGDAAHSIHPLAGQGVNLGFADVQELAQQLVEQPLSAALAAYETTRVRENQQMMRAMDAIHVGFRSQHLLPRGIVAAGLAVVNKFTPLKSALVRKATGF